MTLIFIGDLHGHLVPRADVRNKPQRLVGGLARMYRRIETIRQRSSASVLIHAGNTIQGSAEALFTRGAAQVSVPNQPEFRRGGDESMMTTLDPETASTQSVMDGLQRALANAFVLYANYKRYHWQTFGPSFRDLHLLFDELGAAVMADIDPLGERIRILGGDPVAGADEVQAQAAVEPARIGASMRQVVEQAVANERTVSMACAPPSALPMKPATPAPAACWPRGSRLTKSTAGSCASCSSAMAWHESQRTRRRARAVSRARRARRHGMEIRAPRRRPAPAAAQGGVCTRPATRSTAGMCRSGHRSALAAGILRARGYQVENVEGGIHAWRAAGLPLEG